MEQLAHKNDPRPPVWAAGRAPERGAEPTARMIEYLARRANGQTQKEAARALDLSVPGARRLDAESRTRLGAATTAQAVAAAIARGLLVAGCCLLIAALQVANLAQLTSELPAVARRAPTERRGGGDHGGGRRGGRSARRCGTDDAPGTDTPTPLALASGGTGPDWGAIGRPGPGLAADDLAARLAADAARLDPTTQAANAAAADREALAWT